MVVQWDLAKPTSRQSDNISIYTPTTLHTRNGKVNRLLLSPGIYIPLQIIRSRLIPALDTPTLSGLANNSMPSWFWALILFTQRSAAIARLSDDRRPALYTGDFGNCMENSAIRINRFNAAYYVDNATVVFDIDGQTSLVDENLMSE